ncbi:LysE/ArgO family amino acid transporter [Candidatus Pseudothioglobus sp. Uisw_041]|uniref:LysE/ArgO family amino acid transporter n=1 Tax=Candidatus Pseudothioglobus sp. Uisw_041 TaxID=3230996 RepID=UPI003A8882D8
MIHSFLTGFFLGFSLIVAIGAQNTFVLRQGILGQHVFYIALFCALSDALLICIGVAGISFFLSNFISQNSNILFGLSAVWLTVYGLIRLRSALKSNNTIEIEASILRDLLPTISIAAVLTFLNPHVYLDTMILIGSISQQFSGFQKITFALGACLASFVFFFSLAYGARLLTPIMLRPFSWKILDGLVAFIMFTIAFQLASAGNYL